MEATLKKTLGVLLLAMVVVSGCSNKMKIRQEQREKVAANTGLFCEFVSGDDHKDVDVELTFAMAKRCDSNKNYSVTSYKSSSEINGLVYCCSIKNVQATPTVTPPPAAPMPSPAKASPAISKPSTASSAKPAAASKKAEAADDDDDVKAVVPATTSP